MKGSVPAVLGNNVVEYGRLGFCGCRARCRAQIRWQYCVFIGTEQRSAEFREQTRGSKVELNISTNRKARLGAGALSPDAGGVAVSEW